MVTVVGGGHSGLVTAFAFVQHGFQVRVIEKTSQIGGVIQTLSWQDHLVETAAVGWVRTHKLLYLFEAIGAKEKIPSKDIVKKYVYCNGKPRRWPLSLAESAGLLRGVAVKLLDADQFQPTPGECMERWAERVFSEAIAKKLILPGLQGLYGHSTEQLSANLVLQKMKLSRGKKIRQHKTITAYPEGGMRLAMEKLKSYLVENGVEFRNESVSSDMLNPSGDDKVVVCCGLSEVQCLDFSSTPLAEFVGRLKKVPTVTLSSINMLSAVGEQQPKGYGILFPSSEKFHSVGLQLQAGLFVDSKTSTKLQRWIHSSFNTPTEDQLRHWVHEDFAKLYGVPFQGEMQINIAPNVLPFYGIELEKALDIKPEFKGGLALLGNYMGSVGLSDVLESAWQLARSWK